MHVKRFADAKPYEAPNHRGVVGLRLQGFVAVSIPAPTHRFNEQRDALAEALLAFRDKLRTIVGR